MDRWRYFDISHRDHVICNPVSSPKLDEMIGLLRLPEGARVLDVGCGKGELLIRLAERYGVSGTGIDLSPPFVEAAKDLLYRYVPQANIEILEMDGADYTLRSEPFDLAACLGASWIWGGYAGTLEALTGFVRPGGLILSGEPFWKKEPDSEYIEIEDFERDAFATHDGNVQIGIDQGLVPLYTLVSSDDDFDRYEALQWQATERWAAEHPDDPDRTEVLEHSRRARDIYLHWGRDTIGWALYLFMKPAPDQA